MKQIRRDAKRFIKNLLGEEVSFAMLLRSIRTRDDLTQQELAGILEITVSHVSDIENYASLSASLVRLSSAAS